jgi:hypothetical protein
MCTCTLVLVHVTFFARVRQVVHVESATLTWTERGAGEGNFFRGTCLSTRVVHRTPPHARPGVAHNSMQVASPGLIDTPMFGQQGEAREQFFASLTASHLVPRRGTPDEVAGACASVRVRPTVHHSSSVSS